MLHVHTLSFKVCMMSSLCSGLAALVLSNKLQHYGTAFDTRFINIRSLKVSIPTCIAIKVVSICKGRMIQHPGG